MTRLWNKLRSKPKDWKATYFLIVFGRNKTKGRKQDSQHRLRSPMPKGVEP
jgi:hypothetical protein